MARGDAFESREGECKVRDEDEGRGDCEGVELIVQEKEIRRGLGEWRHKAARYLGKEPTRKCGVLAPVYLQQLGGKMLI